MRLSRRAGTAKAETRSGFRLAHAFIAGLLLLFVSLLVILVFLPWVFTGSLRFWELNQYAQASSPPDRVALVNAQIQATVAFVQLLGGVFLLSVLYTGYQSMRHAQEQIQLSREQIRVSQEGQITDRFTKAIEQLGASDASNRPQIEVRLGGIYALERIAKDSPRDYWTIMEVLTAYIREHAPAPKITSDDEPIDDHEVRRDIQAILTVLGRRTGDQRRSDEDALDLRNTDLRGANLSNSHFEDTLLGNSRLEGADLMQVHLEGANLQRASLKRVWMPGAHLKHAFLAAAQLTESNLTNADLEQADLTGANLHAVRLTNAILDETKLHDAVLTQTTGLTQRQIDSAYTNNNTILPSEPGPDGTSLRHSPRV